MNHWWGGFCWHLTRWPGGFVDMNPSCCIRNPIDCIMGINHCNILENVLFLMYFQPTWPKYALKRALSLFLYLFPATSLSNLCCISLPVIKMIWKEVAKDLKSDWMQNVKMRGIFSPIHLLGLASSFLGMSQRGLGVRCQDTLQSRLTKRIVNSNSVCIKAVDRAEPRQINPDGQRGLKIHSAETSQI